MPQHIDLRHAEPSAPEPPQPRTPRRRSPELPADAPLTVGAMRDLLDRHALRTALYVLLLCFVGPVILGMAAWFVTMLFGVAAIRSVMP